MITLDTIKGLIRTLVGDKAIKMLGTAEWQEFTEYGKAVVKLQNAGVDQMGKNGGNVDLKELNTLHRDFNAESVRFANRLSFGVDQKGNKVSFTQLFGEIISAHPSALPSLCARMFLLWAIEHKINMKYREKYEGKKPRYETAAITNREDLPRI